MIDYATRNRAPSKHVVGFALVVLLHALIFWAVNSGLSRTLVKAVRPPVEVNLIAEVKPELLPPPPRAAAQAENTTPASTTDPTRLCAAGGRADRDGTGFKRGHQRGEHDALATCSPTGPCAASAGATAPSSADPCSD